MNMEWTPVTYKAHQILYKSVIWFRNLKEGAHKRTRLS